MTAVVPAVSLAPSATELFKAELWKDQRQLEVRRRGGRALLLKHCDSEEDARAEAEVLRHLRHAALVAEVPHVIAREGAVLVLPYVYGVRVFNVLVDLDAVVDSRLIERAREAKRRLLERCEERQRDIQAALMRFGGRRPPCAYPIAHKIETVVAILAECLGIAVDREALTSELDALGAWWNRVAAVPFRDATTKNMLLDHAPLSLMRVPSEAVRRERIEASLRDGSDERWLEAPIIDYDFASCGHDTTPEDDPVSLRYHERTWAGGPPDARALVWHHPADAKRAAVTFVVRYLRFGGRKAAYRLLHPAGHQIRFRHDHARFYFERLPAIAAALWPAAWRELGTVLSFASSVARRLGGASPRLDGFLASGLAERRQYYVDVYPR